MSKLLIIDDEPIIRKLLAKMMELEGYEVFQAEDFHTGMSQLNRNHPQVVLCDVFLPDGNGVELIPKMKECAPDSEIVMLTAHGNIEDGVKAIKNGAFDYITKGDDNNKIIPIISRAMDKAGDHQTLKKKTTNYTFDSIIGSSPGIQFLHSTGQESSSYRCFGTSYRRDRHRKRGLCTGNPQWQQPSGTSICGSQLLRFQQRFAGE